MVDCKNVMKKNILVTGSLGFIGFHVCKKLINNGHYVHGIDNINSYYNVKLKLLKLPELGINVSNLKDNNSYKSKTFLNFKFSKLDITDISELEKLFDLNNFDIVINLAAQAGVQFSITNPYTYIRNNINGFTNIIECSKNYKIKHFIYASSSSVYGDREDVPFKEEDNVDHPISLYAATKKSNELIAHSYSHLFNLKTTGLRFFTVYGPWGRPDMAPFIFLKNIIEEKPINVYNNGNMLRDFTYIDDIVNGVISVDSNKNLKKFSIYNIGNSNPYKLMDFIKILEDVIGKKAKINFKAVRKGDVLKTYSDISKIRNDFNYNPTTTLNNGLKSFYDWYNKYIYNKNII